MGAARLLVVRPIMRTEKYKVKVALRKSGARRSGRRHPSPPVSVEERPRGSQPETPRPPHGGAATAGHAGRVGR